MSTPETIICRPSKWFLWRAVAMVTLFGVFSIYFFKDWKVGYPKKNVVYYSYQAFLKAREEFGARDADGLTAAAWESFAREQEIGFPTEPGLLPAGVDPHAKWPDALVDFETYEAAYRESSKQTAPPLWLDYSHQQGWGSEAPEGSYDAGEIKEQLYFGIFMAVLTGLGVFYLVRTLRRTMSVDGEAYHAPDGTKVPFDRIRRIDKRKWDSKGLAYLYHEQEGGGLAKVKVDGMVYGQFRPEDGAPAERLFERILKNFSGELLDLEDAAADAVEPEAKEAPKD